MAGLLVAGVVVSCSSSSAPIATNVSSSGPTGEVTVFAAASLTDAFTDLGNQFHAANPRLNVSFNFGSSSALVTQIDQGARADLFASADQAQMDRAESAGLVDGLDRVFATNRLVVVASAASPAVRDLPDLARVGVKLVTSHEAVPVGVYTQSMLQKMSADARYGSDFRDRVNANIVSRETDVRQILAKVQLGEADAGVVYRTDVTATVARQVVVIPVPDEFNTVATYPIVRVKEAPNPSGADAFLAYLILPAGQAVLAKWNFGPPA